VGGIYFCFRSLKGGYWGKDAEDVKYHVFDEFKEGGTPHGRSN